MLVFRKICVRTKWMITLDQNYQESITEGYLGSYQSSMMKLSRCRNVETVAQNSAAAYFSIKMLLKKYT